MPIQLPAIVVDAAANISPGVSAGLWRQELRATFALAWPLILANLTQQTIQATDILLMGRLGATQLAAATLALNLTFTFNIFLLGLITASAPMMATALGQRFNAVRDVRRTFRAGLWLIAIAPPPYWFILWHVGDFMRAFGQAPELADQGQTFLRAYMWCTAPWLLFQLLRNFVSALERPRVVLWLSLAGIAVNALLSWSLIFGHFGLPALGLVGGGLGSTLTWLMMCGALVAVVMRERRFRRFHVFGHMWRFDRQRTRSMAALGWPIAVTMALEMGVFALAAYFMGWIGAPAVAAHAVALQIAALTFMVPLGLGQAVTVRVGLALGRRDEAGITRAGWTAWVIGVSFMATMALVMWSVPRPLVTVVPHRCSRQCAHHRPCRQLPQGGGRLPAVRRSAGDRRRNAARPPRYALAVDLRTRRLLGDRPRHRLVAGVQPRLARRRHLDRAGERARRCGAPDARAAGCCASGSA